MKPSLHITLLGSLSAHFPMEPEAPPVMRFRTQKTAALFAYLAYRAGVPQSREELVEIFWSNADIDAGRMSLRTALSSLRKSFGEALSGDKTFVVLHATTDLQQFLLALRTARNDRLSEAERVEQLRKAVEFYGGSLLPGFYDDWAIRERDRLEAEYRAALTALARWHSTLREYPPAIDYARRAVASDPLSEEIRADLIRLLKQSGAKLEARRQFEDIERLLSEQIGEEPSDLLLALVADVPKSSDSDRKEPAKAVRLPSSRGRFRGRQEALTQLVLQVTNGVRNAEQTRLFTLFGPGGIGKTRLAIETARRIATQGIVEEVWFVPLVTATHSEQVWTNLLQTLGIARTQGSSDIELVSARLSKATHSLLIFDNLEQVALDAGEIASELLSSVSGLILLATSRRRLGIPDEQLFALQPLTNDDAVGLFIDRARGVSPHFAPSEAEKETILKLIERLEGFPLAIELATAWSSVLSPAEMLSQIESSLLTLPKRQEGEARHQSLSGAIQWSVSLLSPELQRAFHSLSVFRGGWDAPSAESICGVQRDTLASLRDRSMITAQTQENQIRFGIHEALREFGESALSAEAKAELSTRHTAYFVSIVDKMDTPRFLLETPNLNVALNAATPEQERHLGLKLAPFWEAQGQWREERQVLERIVAQDRKTRSTKDLAETLTALGQICYHMCDFDASEIHHTEALEISRSLEDHLGMGRAYHLLAALAFHRHADLDRSRDLVQLSLEHFTLASDPAGQAAALIGLGVLTMAEGHYQEACEYQERSLAIAKAAGLTSHVAKAHQRRGMTAIQMNELELAEQHLTQSYTLYKELNEPTNIAMVSIDLGVIAYNKEDMETARQYYEEGLGLFREIGENWAVAIAVANLARIAQSQQNYGPASAQWSESLRLRVQNKDKVSIVAALDGIAGMLFCIAVTQGVKEVGLQAIRLRAASTTFRKELGLAPAEAEDMPEYETQVQEELGEEVVQRVQQEGEALSWESATTLALETLEQTVPQPLSA